MRWWAGNYSETLNSRCHRLSITSSPVDEMMMWQDLVEVLAVLRWAIERKRNLRKLKFRSHNCQVFSIKGNYNKRRRERKATADDVKRAKKWRKTHFLFSVVLTERKDEKLSRSRPRGSAADLNYSSWCWERRTSDKIETTTMTKKVKIIS